MGASCRVYAAPVAEPDADLVLLPAQPCRPPHPSTSSRPRSPRATRSSLRCVIGSFTPSLGQASSRGSRREEMRRAAASSCLAGLAVQALTRFDAMQDYKGKVVLIVNTATHISRLVLSLPRRMSSPLFPRPPLRPADGIYSASLMRLYYSASIHILRWPISREERERLSAVGRPPRASAAPADGRLLLPLRRFTGLEERELLYSSSHMSALSSVPRELTSVALLLRSPPEVQGPGPRRPRLPLGPVW